MLILGIETSCDETAAAVVRDGTQILSNVVASSQQMHAASGGIIPENAAREQIKAIIPVIKESLAISHSSLDAIAVTVGPGLIGSLLVGVETAKTLAYAWNRPIVPVNHLVGHIYANWLLPTTNYQLPTFPALILLVSGGHTELILMKDHGEFSLLGGTRDDASGECFDKCARLLNLGYPGGPAIEAAASQQSTVNSQQSIKLPRPMINSKNFDFSFSGLKTAVANLTRTYNLEPSHCAFEIQEAITDVLVAKAIRAAEKYAVNNILLAGGVAANKRLREKFKEKLATSYELQATSFFVPEFRLCTDNAAYIASAAFFNYHPIPWQDIQADPGLTIDNQT
jgi:N6-L-threonylcarbamoyladenine synthase